MLDRELNRRQFGKHAAGATAAGSLALLATGLVPPNPQSVSSALAEDHPPAIAEPIPPSPIPVEILLLEVVRQLNPDRKLTHEYLEEVRRDIANELRRAKVLRAFPLQNANEPAAMFAAYRAEQ
jgi:hypothetical protein